MSGEDASGVASAQAVEDTAQAGDGGGDPVVAAVGGVGSAQTGQSGDQNVGI